MKINNRHIKILSLCFLLLFPISVAVAKGGPSYDCLKATKWDEKLICKDQKLSKLDVELNNAYKEVLKSTNDTKLKAAIKNYQIGWLKDRRKCKDWYRNNIRELDWIDDSECIKEIYQVRINELKNLSHTIDDIKKDDPFGFYNMGHLYNSGSGIEEDKEEAENWFMQTTKLGKALDASCLAKMTFGYSWNWFVLDNWGDGRKKLRNEFSISLGNFQSRKDYFKGCEYKSIAIDEEGFIESISDYGPKEYKILGRLDNGIYVVFANGFGPPNGKYSSIRFVKGPLWASGHVDGDLILLGQIIRNWKLPKVKLRGNTTTIFDGGGVIQVDLKNWEELISFNTSFPGKSTSSYVGKIGTKNIEANLNINEFNISGTLSHKDNGETYEVKGYVNNFEFKLKEFKNNQVMGEYKGKFESNQNLSGVWSRPNQAEETSFYLTFKKDKDCRYLSDWTGFPNKAGTYIHNKVFKLFVKGEHDSDNISVNLTFMPSGETKTIEIMEYAHFGSLGSPDTPLMKNRVQLSQNGSLAVVSGKHTSKISLYDTSTWEKVGTLEYATFSLSPNGKYLAVAGFGWKFGWELSIYEIDGTQKNFIIGRRRVISGTAWGDEKDEDGYTKKISGLCLNGSSDCDDVEWYQGQEFSFSKDSNYLIIEDNLGQYNLYDPNKNSVKNILCASSSSKEKYSDN